MDKQNKHIDMQVKRVLYLNASAVVCVISCINCHLPLSLGHYNLSAIT